MASGRDSHAPDAARMWRTDDFGGIELLRATLTEFAFRPHAHEEFFIALTEEGLATPTYRGSTHVIGRDEVIVLNPEEPHAGGAPEERSWTYRALYVHRDVMRRVGSEFAGERAIVPEFGGDVVRDAEVAARLHRFHQASEQPGSATLERAGYLVAALALLIGRHAMPSHEPKPRGRESTAVRLSREYLDEHAPENVTLEALAGVAGLSPFHLCRVFQGAVGLTPHAYQTQARIRRAKFLLRAGQPIALVAAQVGFCDQAHLTRQFKRIVGLTPGRYVEAGT